MTIKCGIVMDPIGSIKTYKDTTFAMALAAQKAGWQLYYMELPDLYLEQGAPRARMRALEVRDDPEKWYTLTEASEQALAELDVVLMRKDPPVDAEFVYATYILERAEQEGVLVINRPQSLRDCNEKLYATHFPQCCPRNLVSRDRKRLKEFLLQHGDVVFKPLDGMGGSSIFHARVGDPNVSVILETLTLHDHRQVMAQTYLPQIKQGDKRILIIDGEPVPFCLARVPGEGELRGNLAAGGQGEARELTPRDRWIVEQISADLKKRGLIFVGIDVIGDYLTEINVTSPTCVRELDQLCKLDIGGQLMSTIEDLIAKKERK